MAHGDNALLDEAEAEVAEHPTSPSLLRRLKEPRIALISLIAVALVAALVVLGFQMYSANQEDTLRQEALDTARDYSTIMSSFGYQNLDANKDSIASMSTDEFAGTYRTMVDSLREVVAGGKARRAQRRQTSASNRWTIRRPRCSCSSTNKRRMSQRQRETHRSTAWSCPWSARTTGGS